MRRNFILSESEIRQLVKKTLLNEQRNRTIQDLQTLLFNKGFTEVGTADNKAGQNTLSALNRALSLGLNLYRPQAAKQNTQTNIQPKNVVKNPYDIIPIETKSVTGLTTGEKVIDVSTTTTAQPTNAEVNKEKDKGVSFNSVKK